MDIEPTDIEELLHTNIAHTYVYITGGISTRYVGISNMEIDMQTD